MPALRPAGAPTPPEQRTQADARDGGAPMELPIRVLALCNGHRTRAIFPEAMLNAREDLCAHAAGSTPREQPHPVGLSVFRAHGIAIDGLRSKSSDEFASDRTAAPRFDMVITSCDAAAGTACPLWHTATPRADGSLPDPSGIGEGEDDAFARTFAMLAARIDRFAALPPAQIDFAGLAAALNEIGSSTTP